MRVNTASAKQDSQESRDDAQANTRTAQAMQSATQLIVLTESLVRKWHTGLNKSQCLLGARVQMGLHTILNPMAC